MARPEFNAGPACSMMLSSKVSSPRRLADAVEGDQLIGQLLQAHLVGELLQRHRRGPDIAHALQRVDGPALALFGERVAHVDRAVGVAHSQRAQQLPVDGHLHQVRNNVVGQLDGFDELAAGLQPAHVDQLHQQAEQIQARRFRWPRCRPARRECASGRPPALAGRWLPIATRLSPRRPPLPA